MRWSLAMSCLGNPAFALKLTVAPAPGEVNSGAPGARALVISPSGSMSHGARPDGDRSRAARLPHHTLPESRAGARLARRDGSRPPVVPAPLAERAGHGAPLRLARHPLRARPPLALPAPPPPPGGLGGYPAPARPRDPAAARDAHYRHADRLGDLRRAGYLRARRHRVLDLPSGHGRLADPARRDRLDARLRRAALLAAAQALVQAPGALALGHRRPLAGARPPGGKPGG